MADRRITMGAIGELLAAADLMARGYEVYRALGPQTSCDLIALDRASGRMLRIEVRSGALPLDHYAVVVEAALDHYAVIVAGQVALYDPPLPELDI